MKGKPRRQRLLCWFWHCRLTDYDDPKPVSFEATDFDVQAKSSQALGRAKIR